jgi:hypothetical protein
MSDRDEIAGMLNRFSSVLADVERSLCSIDEDCYEQLHPMRSPDCGEAAPKRSLGG